MISGAGCYQNIISELSISSLCELATWCQKLKTENHGTRDNQVQPLKTCPGNWSACSAHGRVREPDDCEARVQRHSTNDLPRRPKRNRPVAATNKWDHAISAAASRVRRIVRTMERSWPPRTGSRTCRRRGDKVNIFVASTDLEREKTPNTVKVRLSHATCKALHVSRSSLLTHSVSHVASSQHPSEHGQVTEGCPSRCDHQNFSTGHVCPM